MRSLYPVPVMQLVNRFIFASILILVSSGMNIRPYSQVSDENKAKIDQFDLLTPLSGWILLDQQLFWTSNAGETWDEVSPPVPGEASVQDVIFMDSGVGWVLWSITNPDESATLQLAHTLDQGHTWTVTSLSLFEPDDPASYVEKAEMGWLDERTGWISVKQKSGSNFSLGWLFTTSNGGRDWLRHPLPVADALYFNDLQTGWAVGGPTNDQLYKTQDAGETWEQILLGNTSPGQSVAYLPHFSGPHGLFVITHQGPENSLAIYSLDSQSGEGSIIEQLQLDSEPGIIALSILDAQSLVATLPGTKSIFHMRNGQLQLLENEDGLSASIVELDMVSQEIGWAKSITSNCDPASAPDPVTASAECSFATHLLGTTDGGVTWKNMEYPFLVSEVTPPDTERASDGLTPDAVANLENTDVFVGQGFDRCEIPTLSQMQAWWGASPYKAVNLYIGGSSRACSNNALTSSYLFQLHQQGWKFIPTWVGPQAPCTGYRSRMSSDAATAYQQGVMEANLAVDQLSALGLTDPSKAGSIVYYDIEHYGTNMACRSAVNAFMNGWVSQMRALGNLAGVYGSTLCNTGLSDFLSIANVPDAIWAARWYHNLGEGYYNPNASVWNLGSCIPNSAWSNHQRIRQYEGDHYETWGNLTLDIDSNVLDGVVAVPHNYPFVSRVARTHPNPTNAASVAFTVTFSKPVTGVDGSDFSLSAGGVTGASVGTVTGSGTTYTVTVNTGSGDGTIRLNVLDNNSIVDSASQPLGGTNTGGGNFTYGEIYTVLKSADVAISIGRNVIDGFVVPIGTSLRVDFPAVDDGPVKVTHMKGRQMAASLRAIWKVDGAGSSYSELMGMPAGQLSTEYYFPWYNNIVKSLLDEQLRFANADTTPTTIEVLAGRQVLGMYELDPGESMRIAYDIDNGPIRIRSTDGKKIIASMRAVWKLNGQNSSYSELMGLPKEQLSSDYYFPWYNNVVKSLLDEQFRFGNVDTTATTVQVLVGNTVLGTYSLDPGESMRVAYDIDNGPIRIRSTDGKKIIAAMRAVWKWNGQYSSYSELMGLPAGQLSADYYFPWYENAGPTPLDEQFRFANVDSAATTIQVSRGATILGTYGLAAGESLRQSFNLGNGPIRVRSLDGRKIIVAKRSVWMRNGQYSSYSEMMGLPAGQLSTEYYFPWYNNAVPSLLDEQFRLGVP